MQKLNNKESSNLTNALLAITFATCFIPEITLAAGDAFGDILTKANGWVGGSAGKLVTFTSLAIAGIMGVAGFPTKHVAGAVGVGLLLSSANSIVNMIF